MGTENSSWFTHALARLFRDGDGTPGGQQALLRIRTFAVRAWGGCGGFRGRSTACNSRDRTLACPSARKHADTEGSVVERLGPWPKERVAMLRGHLKLMRAPLHLLRFFVPTGRRET